MEKQVSEPNKPAGEGKSQPAPKPSPAKPDSFTTDRMLVGDSAEGLKRKSKQ